MALPPYAWVGTVGALLAVVMAAVVFSRRPQGAANRALAWLLFVEAGDILSSSVGLFYLTETGPQAIAAGVVHIMFDWIALAAYLNFIGVAVGGPLAGWLRPRWVRATVLALASMGAAATAIWPAPFVGTFVAVGGEVDLTGGVLFMGLASLLALVFSYGLLAAIAAWWTQEGSLRRRNAFFAVAIAFRDVPWAVAWAGLALLAAGNPAGLATLTVAFWALPIGLLVFLALLGYGLLREQVLGIDLSLKLGISRGTVAAIIAGAAFLGSELVEQALGVGQTVPAILIAAAAALAFRPLVRLGNRVADRFLPDVEDTPAYRERRAREVYRAALEGAAADGEVTGKEHDMLTRLQVELGIGPAEAKRLEAEAVP